jgi:hypothetical protein
MTGVAKNTIVKLLVDLGAAVTKYQHETLRNLPCKRLQADEIWAFVGGRTRTCPTRRRTRGSAGTAYEFMTDVAGRLRGRVQLTTDGHKPYLMAVEGAFGADIDYATLTKIYGNDPEGEKRYSPAKCLGVECKIVAGDPEGKHISTSYVERQNLTMRMSMRRFTRLTNAFSKQVENHTAAVALYFMYYNFARVHQTLRVTPAMEAGVSAHVWSIAEIVALLDA